MFKGQLWVRMFILMAICAFATVMAGCSPSAESKIEEMEKYLAGYERTGKDVYVDLMLKKIKEPAGIIASGTLFFDEDRVQELRSRYVKVSREFEKAMIQDQRWNVLSQAYSGYHSIHPTQKVLLSQAYSGNDPDLLAIVGEGHFEAGNRHQAYTAYAKAALSDHDNAHWPRGLAAHYGCVDLDAIWGELAEHRKSFKGSPLPMGEPTLSRRELLTARTALRKGQLPEIPESCPLHPDF